MKIKSNQKPLAYTAIIVFVSIGLIMGYLAYQKYFNIKIEPRTAVEEAIGESNDEKYAIKEYYDTVYLDDYNAICIYQTNNGKICTAYCVNKESTPKFVCSNMFTLTPDKMSNKPDYKLREMDDDVFAINRVAFSGWLYEGDVDMTVNGEKPIIKKYKISIDGKEYNVGYWFKLLVLDEAVNVKVK